MLILFFQWSVLIMSCVDPKGNIVWKFIASDLKKHCVELFLLIVVFVFPLQRKH